MKKEDQDKFDELQGNLKVILDEFKEFQESLKPSVADLIQIATSKGYKNGNYKCMYDPKDTKALHDSACLTENFGDVWLSDQNKDCNCIYYNGVWAEIIKDELKLNGQEVKVLNGNIAISNVIFTVKSFKELINELLNMGMTGVNHPAFGYVSVSEMQKVCDQIKPF